MSFGNRAAWTSGEKAPRIVGPSVMPATTSPITRGWPSATEAIPNSRATSITTATAMKKAAKRLPASRCLLGGDPLAAGRGLTVAGSSVPAGSRVRFSVRSTASPASPAGSPVGHSTLARELAVRVGGLADHLVLHEQLDLRAALHREPGAEARPSAA